MGRPRIMFQGGLVLALDCSKSGGNKNPVKRKVITRFSPASRRRMIRKCATLGKSIPIFVTLTYPKEWPRNATVWKSHLDAFFLKLRRKDPEFSAMWRLEPQKRGAPHYHLLVYRKDGQRPFLCKSWIAETWAKVIGGGEDSIKAGTRVESIRSSRGAAFYVSKYCAKPDEGIEGLDDCWKTPGRLWGVHQKKNLPEAPQHERILNSDMERRATLHVMKDCFKQSWIQSNAKARLKLDPDFPDAYALAELEWKQAVQENEHLGNTSATFMDAEEFLSLLSAKFSELWCRGFSRSNPNASREDFLKSFERSVAEFDK